MPSDPPLDREAGQHVHPERLRRLLVDLSRFGRLPGGGISRLAFSDDEMAAREWLVTRMQDAELIVRSDAAGNIFGRRRGRDDGLPVILFGSHVDSVPSGGIFDGALGSVGALEVMLSLRDRSVETNHPLEMVIWADEEGVRFGQGLFGSRAATEGVRETELDLVGEDDVSLSEWLERYGGSPERITDCVRTQSSVAAYFELHVEQSGMLFEQDLSIGIVEGIVGIHRYAVEIEGFANHAGTTPMRERKDALYSAARLIQAVREEVLRRQGPQVGNVGQISVLPNAPNVVPGSARFPIELRDISEHVVQDLIERIEGRAQQIASEDKTSIRIETFASEGPAMTDGYLKDLLEKLSDDLHWDSLRLPSGAGHDAQNIARHGIPTGMIFIPSYDGISHNPNEWSDWKDCARGVELLYRAVLEVDRTGAHVS